MFRTNVVLPFSLGVAACSLEPDPGEPTFTGVEVVDQGDGVFSLEVDASDREAWVYFSFANRMGIEAPADPESSLEWDLAFRRFLIKSNGGVSGAGSVSVAALSGVAFDDLEEAPATGYLQDVAGDPPEPDPGTPDNVIQPEVDYAFNVDNGESPTGWYGYDPASHTLSPAAVVYVVQALDGRFYKLEFVRYYDLAGSPAILTLRFAEVPQAGRRVDAASGWTYLTVAGAVVAIPDPDTSSGWDFAINRTRMRTNSGSSGSGLGGAMWAAEDAAYEDLSEVTTVGFVVDRELQVLFPMNAGLESGNPILWDWYHYNATTHEVSPKERVLLVRGADGESYGKLQVVSYADGVFRLRTEPVKGVASVVERMISADDPEAWVHMSLRTGEVGTASSSADLDWDIAFSRTRIKTNSGMSGEGAAGALELAESDIARVTEAPVEGYAVDTWISMTDPPGSAAFSGNPVLNSWFDYDDVSQTFVPRDVVYAVRTANGDYSKLEILDFQDGVLTVSFAYAGPQRTAF